ncbi:MAG: ABC transporter permease, partial [Hoylesella buccalis]
VEDSNLANEKAISFLSLVVSIVMVVGLFISLLSFYILLLSIYLLVQKNADKLENLLLIGYRPLQVSKPYIFLTLMLNVAVLLMAVLTVYCIRDYYIEILYAMLPSIDKTSMLPTCLLGFVILTIVSFINSLIIHRRISSLYKK